MHVHCAVCLWTKYPEGELFILRHNHQALSAYCLGSIHPGSALLLNVPGIQNDTSKLTTMHAEQSCTI